MRKCRLTKLSDAPNALRTRVIEGYAPRPPTLACNFRIYSEGLDFGDREVVTNLVVRVEPDGTFETKSGTIYKYEELSDGASNDIPQ